MINHPAKWFSASTKINLSLRWLATVVYFCASALLSQSQSDAQVAPHWVSDSDDSLSHIQHPNDSTSTNQSPRADSTKVYQAGDIDIIGTQEGAFGKLEEVDGFGIYSGRKSEVIRPEKMNLNTATGSARQLYAKVAGLNIWENDPGGLQLGIGGRGLSPSRVSNFNTRQNGYDISADALGYPESYYIPTTQMVERIAIVRGAAALQYGTQFGGFVGYKIKSPARDRILKLEAEQSVGSYGLLNSFLSGSGSAGKWDYITMFQYKEGDGWRENSNFHSRNLFTSIGYNFTQDNRLQLDYTMLDYVAKQAGGLTDAQFYSNPRESHRQRNWFSVDWHILSLSGDFKVGESTKLNTRNFLLLARREALGYLGIIGRSEPLGNRDLLRGEFNNFGNETRLIHHYGFMDEVSSFLIGSRVYFGDTEQKQGLGADGIGADFKFTNETEPTDSDFTFPSSNVAVFAENVFRLNEKLSITPGVRAEYIKTESDGYFFTRSYNLAGDLIFEQKEQDARRSERAFLLFGLGAAFFATPELELYANISQNYRAINFNDLRVVNANFKINPDLRDESGFSMDLGIRGNISEALDYDLSLFNINYNDKIGFDIREDTTLFNLYRFRTNIADARTLGVESFVEYNVVDFFDTKKIRLPVFINLSYIHTEYIAPGELAFDGKKLENAPEVILRTGLSLEWNDFSASIQYSYTGKQYTDATNANFSPYAVSGQVPEYDILDLSLKYDRESWFVSAGVTNMTDNIYFTRRATGYPGPGIIPAEPRSFYFSSGFRY